MQKRETKLCLHKLVKYILCKSLLTFVETTKLHYVKIVNLTKVKIYIMKKKKV